MTRIPIALQLYSVRHECEADLPRTLEAVARMGYDGVEFAGFYGYTAEALRRMLDDLGLAVAGSHTPLEDLMGDALERTVAFNRALGNRYLIVPWLPEERRDSRRAWLETASLFNDLAARLKAHGMFIGYHNHTVEFVPLESGELPWDLFFGHTVDDVVMQVDLGNAMHGGGDPVPYIARYPGRAKTIHLKEYAADNDKAIIGEGDVPWAEVFRLCETVGGTEWYIVEQENCACPPLECVERSLQALRAMGK